MFKPFADPYEDKNVSLGSPNSPNEVSLGSIAPIIISTSSSVLTLNDEDIKFVDETVITS